MNIPSARIYTMQTLCKLGWLKGFEPSTLGITIRHSATTQVRSYQGLLDGSDVVYLRAEARKTPEESMGVSGIYHGALSE